MHDLQELPFVLSILLHSQHSISGSKGPRILCNDCTAMNVLYWGFRLILKCEELPSYASNAYLTKDAMFSNLGKVPCLQTSWL
jgi:hypothetical protein